MAQQIPIVDYLVLGDPAHLEAHRCTSCSALYFDRRNACAKCGGTGFSLNVEREDFPRDHIEPPYELEPIEPILDFDLSKYSFAEGTGRRHDQQNSIVGGLAIIQAKRYSIAVGVNHVREPAGAIE